MSITTNPTIPLTKPDIIDLTLDLLATYLGEGKSALEVRLQAAGPNMPIDSLDLFDVLSDVRKATGLNLPSKKCKRDTLRSLDTFADFVMAEVKP